MASSSAQWKYDVFISFRGADVRDGFLSHLFHALCQNQILTFSLAKAESWSNALRETAEISGFDSRNVKPESKLIKEIVALIHERVNHTFPYVCNDDGLIGIGSRVDYIESKLCIGSEDVRFLGIWGMGGIGEDRDHAESVLHGCGFHARIGIGVLLNKALITVSENKLDMHDLLQQMGKDIVQEKCIEEPWNCSRLWLPQDIYYVLTKDLGEILAKSISLDISKTIDINLSSSAFRRMKRLRFLKFYNPYYHQYEERSSYEVIKIQDPKFLFWRRHSGALKYLPDELRYLYWYGYPSKSLPLGFCLKNLVQLHLIHSHIQELCMKIQCFESLKLMDLSYSIKLIRIADLSNFPKLEVLHLRGCTSLVEIRSTRQYNSELRHLNLESCRSLCYVSSFLFMEFLDFLSLEGCSKITDLPSSIGELQLLQYLNLEGCSKLVNLPDSTCSLKALKSLLIKDCKNVKKLPENIGNLKCLEELDATRSGIRNLPPSVNGLVKLESLNCSGCRDLILPPFTGLPSLKRLSLNDCGLSEISESLGFLKSLLALYLDENNLKKLPVAIKQLSKLTQLYLSGNKRLEYIPKLPSTLEMLEVRNCTGLETMSLFTEMNVDSFCLDATNCINLEASCYRKIMDAVLLRIESTFQFRQDTMPQLHKQYQEEWICRLPIYACIGGDKLPRRMKHKNENGSTIFISMEPIPVHFIVVFSAVVASTHNETETSTDSFDLPSLINCEYCFVTESGCAFHGYCYHGIDWENYSKRKDASIIENTLVWVYAFALKEKHRLIEASFRFSATTLSNNLTLKKCGVHLLYSFD
ncbi:Disease resistance protein (TIR-NBS-LRR class) family [Euphorbia peplus]|nr:Disease resistance protein (TIR-NBS-LRR class) family [Euphorbia peplus]